MEVSRLLLLLGLLLGSACASTPRVELATAAAAEVEPLHSETTVGAVAASPDDPAATSSTTATEPAPPVTAAGLLAGGIDPAGLVTLPDGGVAVQPTPEALRDRRLPTERGLEPPPDDAFAFTIGALEAEPLRRSTWNAMCPVPTDDLRYVTVAFWGFDGRHHTGELIIAAAEAEAVVSVFERLHAVRFPIEEMRIVTPADVVARQTGDGNNTASFVCRLVTGGSRFSEHAYGLAIDINPFHNPYQRDENVIPSLASSYLDRSVLLPGMIVPGEPNGDEAIAAFADIGWEWGGNWTSLKDYQHFAKHNR